MNVSNNLTLNNQNTVQFFNKAIRNKSANFHTINTKSTNNQTIYRQITNTKSGQVIQDLEGQVINKFEALLWREALKAMRSSNQYFAGNNNSASNMYLDMYDEKLSQILAHRNSLGVSKTLKLDNANKLPKTNYQSAQNFEKTRFNSNNYAVSQKNAHFVQTDYQQNFVAKLTSHATKSAQKLGINPEYLIAQVALETNWGKQMSGNNLFGIKAHNWTGKSSVNNTFEVRSGKWHVEQASFRNYRNFAHSFADYVNFLQSNPRYKKALQIASSNHKNNSEQFIYELQKAGYATDPNYANKIKQITRQINAVNAKSNSAKTSKITDLVNFNQKINAKNYDDLGQLNIITNNSNLINSNKK